MIKFKEDDLEILIGKQRSYSPFREGLTESFSTEPSNVEEWDGGELFLEDIIGE